MHDNPRPPKAVVLYDLSLPIEARREQRKEFETGMSAAKFLAVPPQIIYKNVIKKLRIYSNAHKKWFAARYK